MAAGSPTTDNDNSPEESGEVKSEPQLPWENSCYASLIDSLSALCTLTRKDAIESSDSEDGHENRGDGVGMAHSRGRRWMAGRLGRLKKGDKQAKGAYFLHLLRTDFPDIWASVVSGTGDTVICVPQSTSLSQEDLTVTEARAHVLTPSEKIPGNFCTLDGWSVSLVGNEVVTGAGFPESRRVRLLLSEDLGHYLLAAGEQPLLPVAATPGSPAATTATAAAGDTAVGGSMVTESSKGGGEGGVGGGEGGSGGDARKKANASAKVVTIAAPSTEGGGHDKGGAGSRDQHRPGEGGAREGASRRRERKVRLMHVSRPLMGGLEWAPENAGELNMTTVDKYAAVLKSYPEVDGMFAEMDSFAKAVLKYCSKNLAAAAAAAAEDNEENTPPPTPASAAHAPTSSGFYTDGQQAGGGFCVGGARAEATNDGTKGGEPSAGRRWEQERRRRQQQRRRRRRRRPEEEELCAVVAEQWRLTAARLTRSRCVKGNGDAEARDRREVTMMQVTESYLLSRLAPGLGAWLVALHADADAELCDALRILRHHTQEDIGVKKQFQCDLSAPVESLRGMKLCATPMDKMLQVKETLKLIQTSVQNSLDAHRLSDEEEQDSVPDGAAAAGGGKEGGDGRSAEGSAEDGGDSQGYGEDAQMATDDVVLLLVCCLLEAGASGNATFLADLAFVKAFHFCEDSTSAVYFALSTLEVALEWLLAKVGRRLSETPAEDGLGSFLSIEDVAGDNASTGTGTAATAAGAGADDGGGWGGEKLSVVPPALCDAALRANVEAELEARRGGGVDGGGGVMTLTLEGLSGDPAEAFPWEPRGARGCAGGSGGDHQGRVEWPRRDGSASGSPIATPGFKGIGGAATKAGGEKAALSAEGGQGGGRTTSDGGMVFGDAGEYGAEQSVMFKIVGESGGGDGDARDGGGGKQVDVVQVSCGKHFFAAVTRAEGGLHTWGLDAADGRLGHGRRDNPEANRTAVAPAAAVGAGGTAGGGGGGAGGGGGEGSEVRSAGRGLWLKAPVRVAALTGERVVQVSCGARHTLAVTSNGHLFAWGDNRYGQCGLPWPSSPSRSSDDGGGGGGGGDDSDYGWKAFGEKSRKQIKSRFFADGKSHDSGGLGAKETGGGSGDGDGMVVPKPSRVLLWQEGDSRPLRVFQVACGRHHSLALARSRSNKASRRGSGGGGGGGAAPLAAATQTFTPVAFADADSGRTANLLYSWGRAGCGRLGRSPPPSSPPSPSPLSLSSSLTLPPPPPPPPRAQRSRSEPSLSSSGSGLAVDGGNNVGGGGGGGGVGRNSPVGGGRSSPPGQDPQERSSSETPPRSPLPLLPPPPPSRAPPGALSMPAQVAADWRYRVNDHRKQGAPLVPVAATAATPAATAAAIAAAASDPIFPFGTAVGSDHSSGGGGDDDEEDAATAFGSDGGAGDGDGGRGTGPVAIAAGWRHSVAVTAEGAVFAWGCGAEGRLGLGSHADARSPRQVRALASRAVRIRQAAAGRAHTLFLSDTGTVYSCGSNEFGQQGQAECGSGSVGGGGDGDKGDGSDGKASPSRWVLAPTAVAGRSTSALSGLRVESVAAGDDHCTVLTAAASGGDGGDDDTGASARRRVFTWGLNTAGQCAQGRAAEVVWTPQEAELLSGARAVGCGAGHTMVVL